MRVHHLVDPPRAQKQDSPKLAAMKAGGDRSSQNIKSPDGDLLSTTVRTEAATLLNVGRGEGKNTRWCFCPIGHTNKSRRSCLTESLRITAEKLATMKNGGDRRSQNIRTSDDVLIFATDRAEVGGDEVGGGETKNVR